MCLNILDLMCLVLYQHYNCPLQEEAERLRFLASSAGKEEYMQLVHKNKMSLIELLEEFPSVRPSLGAFFATICPRLQPRYYSISSSPRMFPSK